MPKWVYDSYFKKWYIILGTNWENDERPRRCNNCEAYIELGMIACQGCCGK